MVKSIFSACMAGLVFLAGANAAWGTVLISDNFVSSTPGVNLSIWNHAPTFSPGVQGSDTHWLMRGSPFGEKPYIESTGDNPDGEVVIGFGNGLAIHYNAGSETLLRVSADLKTGTLTSNDYNSGTDGYARIRGVGLGFYHLNRTADPAEPIGNFTGLVLGPQTTTPAQEARLYLMENGAFSGQSVLWSQIENMPSFNPNTFYRLSYELDTVTGAISNVSLDGHAVAFTSTAFTGDNIHRVAITASTANNATFHGYADNFLFEAVPEPSSFALLGASALGFLGLRRRRA